MERNKMKKKGFTLVELLVVIAIIAMLLAILMPALGKVRQLAQRMVCGTNLAGIGKAMLTYTNDDKYESFPVAGPSGTKFLNTVASGTPPASCTETPKPCSWLWEKKDIPSSVTGAANPAGTAPTSSISASLYLLVKFADVSPDQFICAGGEEKKFDLSKYTLTGSGSSTTPTITDVWDFGSKGTEIGTDTRGRGHNSYSYQQPMAVEGATQVTSSFPVTTTSNPAKAVMADRNPFWDNARADAKPYEWDTTTKKITTDITKYQLGNATAHQKEGQNVLYTDIHTKFEKLANCGIEQDNIYTTWMKTGAELALMAPDGAPGTGANATRECGGSLTRPLPGDKTKLNCPQDDSDNYLVNDFN
jgi:prepilin-type N-terminal cleavage/methylation domain-containing protein